MTYLANDDSGFQSADPAAGKTLSREQGAVPGDPGGPRDSRPGRPRRRWRLPAAILVCGVLLVFHQPLLQQVADLRKVSIDEVRSSVLAGDPATIKKQMQTYIDAGVTHFIINLRRPGLYDLEGVRMFAKEVMPAFRQK